MSDSVRKVRPGQRMDIKASEWNSVADVVNNAKGSKTGSPAGIPEVSNSGIVSVKNGTGGSLDQFAIVQLDGPVIDPGDNELAFKQEPAFSVSGPSGTSRAIGVMQEPLPNDSAVIGKATVSGAARVKLNLPDSSSYSFARPVSSSDYLEPVEIENVLAGELVIPVVWHESGSAGEKWALVLLPGYTVRNSAEATSCGVCSTVPEAALVIDLGDGLKAANQYLFSGLCASNQVWLFTWDTGNVWVGEASDASYPCAGEVGEITSATMTVFSDKAGNGTDEGVLIRFTDSPDMVAEWVNEAAWQSCSPHGMDLNNFRRACECAAWRGGACLVPVPVE